MSREALQILADAGLDSRMHDMVLTNPPPRIYRINARPGPSMPLVIESMKELERTPRFSVEIQLVPCLWSGELSAESAERLKSAFAASGQPFIDAC